MQIDKELTIGPQALLDAVRRAAPGTAADFEALRRVPVNSPSLPAKAKALVLLAVNSAVTHLSIVGTRQAIEAAVAAGATRAEIIECLQLTSVLGIHGLTSGAKLLAAEASNNEAIAARLKAPLDPRQENLKATFTEKRGYWSPVWDTILRLTPDFFEAYLGYSSRPWEAAVLEPWLKELIYVAIDTSCTHMYDAGTLLHMRNALNYGATIDQVVEVLQLTTLIGFETMLLSIPLLNEMLPE